MSIRSRKKTNLLNITDFVLTLIIITILIYIELIATIINTIASHIKSKRHKEILIKIVAQTIHIILTPLFILMLMKDMIPMGKWPTVYKQSMGVSE